MSVELTFRALPHFGDLPLPTYATDGAAGMDVVAAVQDDLVLAPGARMAVPTGLAMAVPTGHEVQVRPRSGLCLLYTSPSPRDRTRSRMPSSA